MKIITLLIITNCVYFYIFSEESIHEVFVHRIPSKQSSCLIYSFMSIDSAELMKEATYKIYYKRISHNEYNIVKVRKYSRSCDYTIEKCANGNVYIQETGHEYLNTTNYGHSQYILFDSIFFGNEYIKKNNNYRLQVMDSIYNTFGK